MSEQKKDTRFSRLIKLALKGLRYLVLNNGWLKLIALVISLVLWSGLISQDENLTRNKTFQNVQVTVTGTDAMKRNGFIVTTDLDELLDEVSIVAAVPQLQYNDAEPSAYNLRVDLSRINSSGEQEIRILSSSNRTYGDVVSIVPSTITVDVDEYQTRTRIPVSWDYTGTKPEEWYISDPSIDPDRNIVVSGPRKIVESISRARIFIDYSSIEWKEGTVVNSEELILYNRSGNPVDHSLLSISFENTPIDSIYYEASIYPTETFAIDAETIQITGTPAPGYQVAGIVQIKPDVVSVADKSEVLSQIDELPMERTIDVTGATETEQFPLKVKKPSDSTILSNDTIWVTVEIVPIADGDD